MVDFNADAILLKRVDGAWIEEKVFLKNVESIRQIFDPFREDIEQINISKYKKIYYSIGNLVDGIDATVSDMNDDRHYMVSPLLLVQCDDAKPVSISDEILKEIKDAIDFH